MVSNWCQANLKTLENKGDLKLMKLGIVVLPFCSQPLVSSGLQGFIFVTTQLTTQLLKHFRFF